MPIPPMYLEMEEVEELVTSTPGKTDNKSKNRWVMLVLILLGIFIGAFLTSNSESLRFWEGTGETNVDDVEENEPTPVPSLPSAPPTNVIEPALAPTAASPLPSSAPTSVSTPEVTSEDTDKAPNPTSPPTASLPIAKIPRLNSQSMARSLFGTKKIA